jgi:uncharacterized repeat protein (TIGR04138 family)
MRPTNPEEDIRRIVAEDLRYPFDAYIFVQDALKHTQRALGRTRSDQKHVGGKELLEGIREYALKCYGPMTPTVLEEWGIRSCEDFGEIVFNMIEHNIASKTEADTRDDFKGGYSFDDAFRKPYLPKTKARGCGEARGPKSQVGKP